LLKNLRAGKGDLALSNVQNYVNICVKEDANPEEVMALARNYVTGYLQLRTNNVNNNNSSDCRTRSTSGVISAKSVDLSSEVMPRVSTIIGPRKKKTDYERILTEEEILKRKKLQLTVNRLISELRFPPKKIEPECDAPNPRRSRPSDVWPTECDDEKKNEPREIPGNLMPTRLGNGAARTKEQLVMRCRTLTRSSSSFPRLATVKEFESLYSTKFGSSLKDDLESFTDNWEQIINDCGSSQSCAFMTRIKAKILRYANFLGNDTAQYSYIAPDSFDCSSLPFLAIDRSSSAQIEKMKRDWQSILPGLIDKEEISKMSAQMYDFRYLPWAVGCDTVEQVRDYLSPKRS